MWDHGLRLPTIGRLRVLEKEREREIYDIYIYIYIFVYMYVVLLCGSYVDVYNSKQNVLYQGA